MGKFHAIVEITEPMRRAPAHHHDTWEICYHTGGVGTATVEDRERGEEHRIDFRPGMIICYPPLLPHYHRSPKGCTMFCILAEAFDPAGTLVPTFTDTPGRAFGRTVELLNEEFRAPQGDGKRRQSSCWTACICCWVAGSTPHRIRMSNNSGIASWSTCTISNSDPAMQ
jgi:mannose-6-phosphate isomerase-like protein (cupin superfamily)